MGATSSRLPSIQVKSIKDDEESKRLSSVVVDEWRNHMFNMFSSFYAPIKTDVYNDVARKCKCPTFLKLWTYFMNGNTVNSDTLLLDYVYNELIADPVNAYSDGTGYSSNKLLSFDDQFDTFMASMSTYTLMKIVLLAFLSQYSTCPHNVQTFRRMNLDSWDSLIAMKEASFTSVSYELAGDWFGEYKARVELRKGTRCIPRFLVSDIMHPEEKEIILSPFVALCQKGPPIDDFTKEFVAVDVNVESGSPFDVLSYHDIKTIIQTKLIVGLLLRCNPDERLSAYSFHEQFKQVTGADLSEQLTTCRNECKMCFDKIRLRSKTLLPRACKAIVGPPPIRTVKMTRSRSRGKSYTVVSRDRKWNTVNAGERTIDGASLRAIFDSLCDPRVSIPMRIMLKNAVRAGRDQDFLTPLVSEFRRFFEFILREIKADPFTPLMPFGWSQYNIPFGTFVETSSTLQVKEAIVIAQRLANWFFKFRTGVFWVKETSRSNRHLWPTLQENRLLVRDQNNKLQIDMAYMYCMNNAGMTWLQNAYVGIGPHDKVIYRGSLTPTIVLKILAYFAYANTNSFNKLWYVFSNMMDRSPAKETDFLELILTQRHCLGLRLFYNITDSFDTFDKIVEHVITNYITYFRSFIKALVKTQTKEYLDSVLPLIKKNDNQYFMYLTEVFDEFSDLKDAAFTLSESSTSKQVATALKAVNQSRVIELIPSMEVSKYIKENRELSSFTAASIVAHVQTPGSIIAYAKRFCFHTLEGDNFGDLAIQLAKAARADLLEDLIYEFCVFQNTEDDVPNYIIVCTRIGIRRIVQNFNYSKVRGLTYMSRHVVETVSREILNTGSDDIKRELIVVKEANNTILKLIPVTEANTRIIGEAIVRVARVEQDPSLSVNTKLEGCFAEYVARAPSRDQNHIKEVLLRCIHELTRESGIPFDVDEYKFEVPGKTSGKRKAKVSKHELYRNILSDLKNKKHNQYTQYYFSTREDENSIIVLLLKGTMLIAIDLVVACRTQIIHASSVKYESGVSSTRLAIAKEFVNEMFSEKPSNRYEFVNVDDDYPSLRLYLGDDQIAKKNGRVFVSHKLLIDKKTSLSIMVWKERYTSDSEDGSSSDSEGEVIEEGSF